MEVVVIVLLLVILATVEVIMNVCHVLLLLTC